MTLNLRDDVKSVLYVKSNAAKMRNDLTANIYKIHTTPLGIIRLWKNLGLEMDDIEKWCKNKIKNADAIIKKGKNWYVYNGDIVITINAGSYTIITAHRIKIFPLS